MEHFGLIAVVISALFASPTFADGFPAKMDGTYSLHPVFVEASRSPYLEVHNNCPYHVAVKTTPADAATGTVARIEVFDLSNGTLEVNIEDKNDDDNSSLLSDTYAEHTRYGEFGFKASREWIKLYKNSYFWQNPLWNKLKIFSGELCEYVRDP